MAFTGTSSGKHLHAIFSSNYLANRDDGIDTERRSTCRHRTVYRVVRLTRRNGMSLGHLCNISDEGMMVAIDVAVDVGESVTVALSEDHRVAGRVAWARDGRCGIVLDGPIDSLALLRELAAGQRAPAYRAPRIEATLLGVAYSELGVHPVRTTNLSQKGMRLSHDGRFQPGLRLLVMLENGIERRGVVRWSHDFSAGLLLTDPLDCTDLNRCVDGSGTRRC